MIREIIGLEPIKYIKHLLPLVAEEVANFWKLQGLKRDMLLSTIFFHSILDACCWLKAG